MGDSRVQQRFGYPVFFWPHCDRNSKKGPFFDNLPHEFCCWGLRLMAQGLELKSGDVSGLQSTAREVQGFDILDYLVQL